MRKTGSLLIALVTLSPFSFSQHAGKRPAPDLPAEVLGPPLVAWSELQTPRPVTNSTKAQAIQVDARNEPSVSVITGTIVKDGNRYFLRQSEKISYRMDNEQTAELYEGKSVRIEGMVDTQNHMVHVTRIESLS